MKISLDEILAGIGVSIVAYFGYKALNGSGIKKTKAPISISPKIKESLVTGSYKIEPFVSKLIPKGHFTRLDDEDDDGWLG